MLAYLFIVFAVIMRIPAIAHPWGFTPITAALLYFGARGSRRQMWIPLVMLIGMDIALYKFVYGYPVSWEIGFSAVWYAAMLWFGTALSKNMKPLPVIGAALTGSVSFFLISNFGAWVSYAMYPKTLAGLMTCYAAGIPFFRRGVAGDLVYTAAMFGLPVVAGAVAHWMSDSHTPTAAA